MPNRVRNRLKVIGDKEHMKEFLDVAIKWKDDMPFWRLSSTIPGPENLADGSPRYENYDWLITNLGTKWDAWTGPIGEAEIITSNDTHFEVFFETAWSPPYPWVVKMIELYPKLNFKLYCTEEMLSFTEIIYNNEERIPMVVHGENVYINEDGRLVRYCDNELLDTNDYENLEFGSECQTCIFSTLRNHSVWFEKEKSDD
jgi:hypothetical protein